MQQVKLPEKHGVRFQVNNKLPHKDEMLLIEGTAYKEDDKIVFSMTMPEDCIFTSPGKIIASLALIEMLAQLCGAQHAFDQKSEQNGRLRGYLVGIDNVIFSLPVHVGDKLDMIVTKVIEMKDIQRVKGEIFRDDTPVGQAELTLFEADEWMSQPEMSGNREEFTGKVSSAQYPRPGEMDAVGEGIVKSICDIEIKQAESAAAVFCFAPDFPAFSGHFPGFPVLPGIVTIYAGWLLAGILENKELDLCAVKKAKFAGPIYPNDKVDVILTRIDNDDEQLDWYDVRVRCREKLAAKYTIGTKPGKKGKVK